MITSRTPYGVDSSSTATIDDIREHYDTLSPLYSAFWGEHIHHGYWHGEESAAEAQENLIRELARRARIAEGDRVLDVGCGLGGSAMYLAREYDVMVKGISLSPKQVSAARDQARQRGLLGRTNFEVQDAHHLERDPAFYDVIWVVECSEHLNYEQEKLVDAVRVGMLCPSFGTLDDYSKWMRDSGLLVETAEDITEQVKRTWTVCRPFLKSPLVKTLLTAGGDKLSAFADSFSAIDDAYRTGAMSYGMFVASRSIHG